MRVTPTGPIEGVRARVRAATKALEGVTDDYRVQTHR